VSYTHGLEVPRQGAVSLGYLRRGAIVEILERRLVNDRGRAESWVLAGGDYQGWIREGEIQIYDNPAQARTAAENMSQ
jgi:hypothetical protein